MNAMSASEDGPLWDQLTLFGPLPQKCQPAPPIQLDLGWNGEAWNAAAVETANAIRHAKWASGREPPF